MAISVPDVGPRHVLLGDPTTALGADMLPIGLVRNISFSESPRTKSGSTITGNENHEAKFYLGTNVTITMDVPRLVASGVRTYLETIDQSTDGYRALGASIPKQTLALVHPDDAQTGTDATASAKTLWVVSVRLAGIAEQGFNADQDGSDDSNFVPLTFETGYVATDQNGTAVPEAAQPTFRGDELATHGMTWYLPQPYGANS